MCPILNDVYIINGGGGGDRADITQLNKHTIVDEILTCFICRIKILHE